MDSPDFERYLGQFIEAYIRNRPLFFALIRPQEAAIFAGLEGLRKKPVLDFGCGDGFFARAVFGERAVEVGLDLAESRVAEARASGAYAEVTSYEGMAIPYSDESFGSAVSNCVLEHVERLEPNVREIARVLRPGGYFLTSVMTDKWEDNLVGTKIAGQRYRDFMRRTQVHRNLLSLPDWEEVFVGCGFEVEQRIGYLSPRTSRFMDLMHYVSAPSLVFKRLFGRWVVFPDLGAALLREPIRRMIEWPVRPDESSAVFFVLRKPRNER